DVRLPYRISRILRTFNFDIVHTHAWGTLIEGIVGAKMAGVPIIIHGEHGTFPQQLTHKYLQQFFWRMTDRLLSVSRELGKKLASAT
ncbi:MAG: glycosyltransferase, partial [Nitrosopumilaceae archaeon]|nr:glycosyltransferase [Nitrosopumilaceae archaeon]NIU88713.1 glycosyltransferase [Nitrosopumilaceae archaeon]NIV65606.1 glycosyltransferase [Nitrosopumilaceae archaeon]NIX61238.1 glycosyltransferase [Nitrosopumilaceae archaeon]